MGFALELAQRITALDYQDLPDDAIHWARIGILDTLGVTLAGANDPCATIVANVLASQGRALLLGTARRVSALDAALVNGTASHALDFDDCNNTLGGHPSAPILPALFALADEIGASGRDFITAVRRGLRNRNQDLHGRELLSVHARLASHQHDRRFRRDGRLREVDEARSRENGNGSRDRGFARVRREVELRHVRETAARRPLFAQRSLRRTDRARRLHGKSRRVRAQAGLLRGVQRRRQLRRRQDPAGLGQAVRHREPRNRGEAVSLLRQHASCNRRHARARPAARSQSPTRSSGSRAGRTSAGSSTPTGPTRKAPKMRNSACSTVLHARSSTAKSPSNISKATRMTIRRCVR